MFGSIKKKVRFRVQSQCECLGEIKVQHVLPNKFVHAVGPFVFLQHIYSCKHSLNESTTRLGDRHSHPHRGMATLTYILVGEVEHLDSVENHVKLNSGGAHWMKAGKGVIYDEFVSPSNCDASVVQLWINLPSKHKGEEPDYFSLLPNEIPKQNLDDCTGWIKVLSGEYTGLSAKIPSYSKEFAYPIQLESQKKISIKTEKTFEYAAFLPSSRAIINDIKFQAGEFIVFTSFGEMIEIDNKAEKAIDIILLGGEPYDEPIVTEGNFVMNTPHEITQAYNDYYDGKYGKGKS